MLSMASWRQIPLIWNVFFAVTMMTTVAGPASVTAQVSEHDEVTFSKDIAPISPGAANAAEPTAFGLGEAFMSTYILPFEVVSVLLLVAMVGATYISRGKSEGAAAGVADGEGGSA